MGIGCVTNLKFNLISMSQIINLNRMFLFVNPIIWGILWPISYVCITSSLIRGCIAVRLILFVNTNLRQNLRLNLKPEIVFFLLSEIRLFSEYRPWMYGYGLIPGAWESSILVNYLSTYSMELRVMCVLIFLIHCCKITEMNTRNWNTLVQ